MDLAELHTRCVGSWSSRLAGIEDRWSAPTPCPDWDVRALVNHVVGEELWTAPLLDGATIADVGDRYDGDVLGEDPGPRAAAAAAEAAAVVERHLSSGDPAADLVHLSFGDTPVEEYVRQLSADHLVHSWDLATATGQDPALDTDLVLEVGAWFAERAEMYRAAGVVGPAVPADDDPQSTLLGAFGRVPGSTAGA